MQEYIWQRFQGLFHGLFLGQELQLTSWDNLHYVTKTRQKLFDRLIHSKTRNWDISEIEGKTIEQINIAEFAIISVPLILFFHENPAHLNCQLRKVGIALGVDSLTIDLMQIWSSLLAILLRGSYERDEKNFLHLDMKLKHIRTTFTDWNACYLL